MYNIIKNIIDHVQSGSYSTTEEQIVYSVCGALIICLVCIFIDRLLGIFRRYR